MRIFSDKENQIIKKIVDTLLKSEPGCLADLQVAKLLRKELNFFALKWTIEPKDEVTIFIPEKEIKEKENNDKLYFEIVNFIYLLEELEDLGFIKFQNIPSNENEKFTILYDREKYSYNSKDNIFWHPLKSVKFEEKQYSTWGTEKLKEFHTFKTSFAKDLQYCALSIVYPLPLAIHYVNNGFKTLEQLQFECQMDTALDSAKSSRKAAYWGFCSFLIAVIALVCSYFINKPIIIDEYNINKIEKVIKENRLSEPIKTSTNDTIIVRQVP